MERRLRLAIAVEQEFGGFGLANRTRGFDRSPVKPEPSAATECAQVRHRAGGEGFRDGDELVARGPSAFSRQNLDDPRAAGLHGHELAGDAGDAGVAFVGLLHPTGRGRPGLQRAVHRLPELVRGGDRHAGPALEEEAHQGAVVVRVLARVVAQPAVLALHRDHRAAALAGVARGGAEGRVAAGGRGFTLRACGSGAAHLARRDLLHEPRVPAGARGHEGVAGFAGLHRAALLGRGHLGQPRRQPAATKSRTDVGPHPEAHEQARFSGETQKTGQVGPTREVKDTRRRLVEEPRNRRLDAVQPGPPGRGEPPRPLRGGARGVVQRTADEEHPSLLHEKGLSIKCHVGHVNPGGLLAVGFRADAPGGPGDAPDGTHAVACAAVL